VTRTPCAPPPVAFKTSSIACGERASTAIAARPLWPVRAFLGQHRWPRHAGP
jgi:hypothetical protein